MTQDDFNKCEKPDPFEITPWSQVEVSRLFFVRRLGQTQSTFVVCIIICSQQGRWMTGWLVKSRHVQLFAESELEIIKKLLASLLKMFIFWQTECLEKPHQTFSWSWGCIFFRPDSSTSSWHMNVKAAYLLFKVWMKKKSWYFEKLPTCWWYALAGKFSTMWQENVKF